MGCILHVTIKNGIFGWKAVDELEFYNPKEAVSTKDYHPF